MKKKRLKLRAWVKVVLAACAFTALFYGAAIATVVGIAENSIRMEQRYQAMAEGVYPND